MDFVAIDFETANEKISSVCQIGIVVVKKDKITEKSSWLVRPAENCFNPFNTYIHGITAEQVETEPEFFELWPKFEKYLKGQTVIAHNASFDVSVLRHVLDIYGLEYPKADFLCSVKIAKKVWTEIRRHGLKSLSQYLGIEFTHHDAAEDAFASAEIVRAAAKKVGVRSLKSLLDKIDIHPGKLYPGGFRPIRQLNEFNLKKADISKLDKEHPLFSQTVVFTGKLESMVRRVAMQKIADVGGICTSSVNEFTDYLVVGNGDQKRYEEGFKSSKIKKTEALVEAGNCIEIINEEEFVRLVQDLGSRR